MTSVGFPDAGPACKLENLIRASSPGFLLFYSSTGKQAKNETLALKFQKKHLNNLRPVPRHLEI